jgi:hypothetical protein
MAKIRVEIDSVGILEILKSAPVAAAVHAEAEKVADNVRANFHMIQHDVQDEVIIGDLTTDRAVTYVTIAHAAGMGMEAKHGVLSKAAGGAS